MWEAGWDGVVYEYMSRSTNYPVPQTKLVLFFAIEHSMEVENGSEWVLDKSRSGPRRGKP